MVDSIQKYSLMVGEREVEFETGKLAKSAAASVTVKCGDTVIIVSTVCTDKPRPGIDFFPLLVDYEEKLYCMGKIPGSFTRKEGRATDKQILISRLIDRPIRPLFPKGYRNDVQIVAATLSSDEQVQPDTLVVLGSSLALTLAEKIPFEGPIGAVRVGEVDGQFIVNPTFQQSLKSDLDIVVAGTEDSVIMVEAGCNFVPEEKILQAVELAQQEIKKQVLAQKAFAEQCGVIKQAFVNPFDTSELKALVYESAKDKVFEAYHQFDRETRRSILDAAKAEIKEKVATLAEDHPIKTLLAESGLDFVGEEFKSLEKKIMRAMIVDEQVRADGRKTNEIRPISSEVGILPRTHGTGLFTRGQTQVLSVATLAGPGLAQTLEGIDPQKDKRYMHSYNFPGYSVGEVKPQRGAGRREIGHGALAERALLPALPSKEDFPYVIRVVSEVLESNGSTSMASTCGSTLALMDAGVPLKRIVAGVAMGLVKEGDQFAVLSDILGNEDHLGDMDFKVAGSANGITGFQMDIKIQGISFEIMEKALHQAKEGRLHILGKMNEAISEPKPSISSFAPTLLSTKIEVDKIGSLIGPGGKVIQGLQKEFGVEINIDEDGTVSISSVNAESARKAKEYIKKMMEVPVVGKNYTGKVMKTAEFGAFVEILPGTQGLLHISQIDVKRVDKVEDVLKVGDEVKVKLLKIENGKFSLSRKALMTDVKEEQKD